MKRGSSKVLNCGPFDKLRVGSSGVKKEGVIMDWMDKVVWLLKGFIIGVIMCAFMCFVLI